jgi:hypothetical protein
MKMLECGDWRILQNQKFLQFLQEQQKKISGI